jgi:hypothetical protein
MGSGWNWLKIGSSGRLSLLVVLKFQVLLAVINSGDLKEVYSYDVFLYFRPLSTGIR